MHPVAILSLCGNKLTPSLVLCCLSSSYTALPWQKNTASIWFFLCHHSERLKSCVTELIRKWQCWVQSKVSCCQGCWAYFYLNWFTLRVCLLLVTTCIFYQRIPEYFLTVGITSFSCCLFHVMCDILPFMLQMFTFISKEGSFLCLSKWIEQHLSLTFNKSNWFVPTKRVISQKDRLKLM